MLNRTASQIKVKEKALDIAFFKEKLTVTQKRLLYLIIQFNNQYKSSYFSQSWLAKQLGLSRKTINESISVLDGFGFIKKYYRQSKTCEYVISPELLEGDFNDDLKMFYKNFFKFSFLFLCSILRSGHDVTQLNIPKGFKTLKSVYTVVSNVAKSKAQQATLSKKEKKEEENNAQRQEIRSTLESEYDFPPHYSRYCEALCLFRCSDRIRL